MKPRITATQTETSLGPKEIIVSKNDLLGEQHNIVRHPDLPRRAFKQLRVRLARTRHFSESTTE